MAGIGLIALAASLIVVLIFATGRRPRLEPSRRAALKCAPGFPRCVVGESHYQRNLLAIVGGYTQDGHDIRCMARLIPERANPFDVNATRVEIAGLTVGHLSRDDAERYRAELAALGLADNPMETTARIRGGWRRSRSDVGALGVYLGFRWPLRLD